MRVANLRAVFSLIHLKGQNVDYQWQQLSKSPSCVCLPVHRHAHPDMHTHTETRTGMHTRTHTHARAHTWARAHIHTHILVCLCTTGVPGACRGQIRASDPPELESQVL